MSKYIYFGELVDGYDIRVLNEREARAGAGILFLFGFISFMNSFILHEFVFTQIFVTVFMLDFIIRIFINPKYAPSLLLGRMMVQNQIPEYVAAPQKRWAWFIGLYLSVIMFFLIVLFSVMTPIKIIICLLCLLLLFSEAAFGICIGCKVFNFMNKENPKLCLGGVCEMREKDDIQKFTNLQKIIVVTFAMIISTTVYALSTEKEQTNISKSSTMKCGAGKCDGG